MMIDILERDVTGNDAGASTTTRVRVMHIQRLKVCGNTERGIGHSD